MKGTKSMVAIQSTRRRTCSVKTKLTSTASGCITCLYQRRMPRYSKLVQGQAGPAVLSTITTRSGYIAWWHVISTLMPLRTLASTSGDTTSLVKFSSVTSSMVFHRTRSLTSSSGMPRFSAPPRTNHCLLYLCLLLMQVTSPSRDISGIHQNIWHLEGKWHFYSVSSVLIWLWLGRKPRNMGKGSIWSGRSWSILPTHPLELFLHLLSCIS